MAKVPTYNSENMASIFARKSELQIDYQRRRGFVEQAERDLAAARANLSEIELDAEVAEYITLVHEGVPLYTPTLSINLLDFLSDPDSTFSAYSTEGLGGLRRPKKALEESNAIGVMATHLAIRVHVRGGIGGLSPPACQIEGGIARKAIVVNTNNKWWVRSIRETGTHIVGQANQPTKSWLSYNNRKNALNTAYDYVSAGTWPKSRLSAPQALWDAYGQAQAYEQQWVEYRKKNRSDDGRGFMSLMFDQDPNTPKKPEIYIE